MQPAPRALTYMTERLWRKIRRTLTGPIYQLWMDFSRIWRLIVFIRVRLLPKASGLEWRSRRSLSQRVSQEYSRRRTMSRRSGKTCTLIGVYAVSRNDNDLSIITIFLIHLINHSLSIPTGFLSLLLSSSHAFVIVSIFLIYPFTKLLNICPVGKRRSLFDSCSWCLPFGYASE